MRNLVSLIASGACCTWIVMLTGCATTAAPAVNAPTVNMPAPFTAHGVTVTVEGLWRSADGVLGVSGTATNSGAVPLTMCEIALDVVDSQGIKVSDAIASTNGLQPGQTWRFQATFTTPFSVSFSSIRPGKIIAIEQRAQLANVNAKPLRFGASFKPIPPGMAPLLKVPAGVGVMVISVVNPSPAFTAGLSEGDIIVRFDGQPITNVEQLGSAVRAHPAGQQAKVEVYRAGSPKTLIALM